MFHNGQIVYYRVTKSPIQVGAEGDGAWAWSNVHYGKTTHFIKPNGKWSQQATEYEIALPRSVEDAVKLLDLGLIAPAPISITHCCICGGWLSSHKSPCIGANHGIKY